MTDGIELAERKYAKMKKYFLDKWNMKEIKTESDLRTRLATAYELESITCHGRSCNFEYEGMLGSALATDSGLKLGNVISLFVDGVLSTYQINDEGKAKFLM